MACSFIIGSIPFGAVIARIRGLDIRKVGSGNIGATNVLRSMGKGYAILTLAGDILKGILAVLLGEYFMGSPDMAGVIGLSAILGHNFSVFHGFRGGKGVATSIGVLMVYSPKAALVTVILWLAVVFITKYSSLGAIISFAALPVNIFLLDYTKGKLIISVIIALLLILRHTGNIKRLINRTESRVGERA